ncbi:MAG: hypothetical protein RSF33_05085 [Hydrogenoanaerobacterium sp.]
MKIHEKNLPNKTSMNFIMKEKTTYKLSHVLIGILAVVTIVAVVGKFGVADRISALQARETELAEFIEENERLTAETADYEEISAVYNKFSSDWMTDEEKALYNRVDILSMVKEQFMASTQVSRFSISGNVLSVDFVNASLEPTSKLVSSLKQFPQVIGVELYTASNQLDEGGNAAISMTVTFQNEGEAVAEGGVKDESL